jgi:hypothetical protein
VFGLNEKTKPNHFNSVHLVCFFSVFTLVGFLALIWLSLKMMLIKKLISFVFQKTLKNEKPENKKFKS